MSSKRSTFQVRMNDEYNKMLETVADHYCVDHMGQAFKIMLRKTYEQIQKEKPKTLMQVSDDEKEQ